MFWWVVALTHSTFWHPKVYFIIIIIGIFNLAQITKITRSVWTKQGSSQMAKSGYDMTWQAKEKCLNIASNDVTCGGRLLQKLAPETGKVRLPTMERLNGGTASCFVESRSESLRTFESYLILHLSTFYPCGSIQWLIVGVTVNMKYNAINSSCPELTLYLWILTAYCQLCGRSYRPILTLRLCLSLVHTGDYSRDYIRR